MELTTFWNLILLFGVTLFQLSASQLNTKDSDEFCEWESFNATCRRDEVVLMKNAKYGRMKLGKCVTKNYGHIGCGTDVMPYMEERCSGRMSCLVSVISLHNKRSCPKDFKSYLQASYECLQVAYPSSETCRRNGYTELTEEQGYISNAISSLKVGWLGRERPCAWRIVAEPYQRINLTLTDFAESPISTTMDAFDSAFAHSLRCSTEYALIVDKAAGRNTSVCASKRRLTNVYLSRSNILNVYVTGSSQLQRPNQRFFLIKYEAVGCPPLVPPQNAWVKADHEHAIIQCNETEEAWFLSCKGTKWVGHAGNCSHVIVEDIDWTITDMFQGVTSFPFGLLIVVALGVAIGVAIGLVMLVSVLVYMKRRRRRRVRSRSNYLLKTISQENAENQCKANADSVTDCSPMLVKRDDLGYTPKEQYYTTWQHQRSLGLPVLHGVDAHHVGGGGQRNSVDLHSLEGVDQDDSVDDLVSPEGPSPPVLSHYHTLPRSAIGPIFTTFKPGKCPLDGDCSPTLHRSSDCVIRTCDEGPYYFKLDHVNSVNKDDDGHKPDLVPGCLECQAQERTQNHHSVV